MREIVGAARRRADRIPLSAFREALASTLIRRTWDVSAHIRIPMHEGRIEIVPPGGLPAGLSEAEYPPDRVSICRNPILANVFFRLGIIEAFGTGVQRVKESYASSVTKPSFSVMENSITVVLPTLRADLGLKPDRQLTYDLLSDTRAMSSGELSESVPFSSTKLNLIVKELIAAGHVEKSGAG